MSYQVIARKWRPQTFEEVTGQESITQTLRNAIEFNRLHHAYIFSGARGVGKTTTARLLAKSLNCHSSEKAVAIPCNSCSSCKEVTEGRSMDVLEFDAASNTQVDKIRDLIIENINISAARDRYKIFIIDEVHMLSTSSFNALLKTLEEPPPNVVFIMATTELHKLPETILSRCQEFQFRTIPLAKINERLKLIADAEGIKISEAALKEVARAGDGSMRDAQSAFDQVISFSGENIDTPDVVAALGIASVKMLTNSVTAILDKDSGAILEVIEELIHRGQDMRNFCRDLLSFLRDLLVTKISAADSLLDSAILSRNEMEKLASGLSESDLIRFFNSLSETESKLRDANNPRYVLEIGLIKLIEMRRLKPIEEILEKLSKLEGGSAGQEKKTLSSPDSASPAPVSKPEKDIPEHNFSAEEVPFAIGDSEGQFAGPGIPEMPEGPDYLPEDDEFIDGAPVFEETPDFPLTKGNAGSFYDSLPVKLPPISADDLAHIDDPRLDAAYEERLLLEGDDLRPIPAASALVARYIASASSMAASANPAGASNGRPKPKFEIEMPEHEDELGEIPVLPDDPDQEALMKFAQGHPAIKRAIRIFRGKITEVKKLGT